MSFDPPRLAVPLFAELRVVDVFVEPFAVIFLLVEPFEAEPDRAAVFEDFALEAFDLVPILELREVDVVDFDAADLASVFDAGRFVPALDAADFDPDFDAEGLEPDFAVVFDPDLVEAVFDPGLAEEVFDPDFAADDDLDKPVFVDLLDFEPPDFAPEAFFVVAILFSSATLSFSK